MIQSKAAAKISSLGGMNYNHRDMNAWYYFWIANFVVSGSAFAIITLIVLVRGLRDLREMFAGLRAEAQRPR